jgi:glyoxylase-like metal-dependent hydrolase (beta-lactamase superfamily II)/rhodanese-related sulfurtransferase
MIFRQLFDRDTWTYTYLIGDKASGLALIVDPVLENSTRDLKIIDELGLKLAYIFETHVHADHITSARQLRSRSGAKIGIGVELADADMLLVQGQIVQLGETQIEVRRTPGHTDTCTSFVLRDGEQTMVLTGDTLLIRGCGRTDFQAGNARQLYNSVHEQIFSLPDDTLIYPGHDYLGNSHSSVGEEKANNPRLALSIDEIGFEAIMDNLNLPHPTRMDVALPANLVCGPKLGKDCAYSPGSRELQASEIPDIRGFRIIDVRSLQEYHGPLGHLPDSELVPLQTFQNEASAWNAEEGFLLTCRSGGRSAQACSILRSMGFNHVTNLAGGLSAWREAEAG